MLNDFVNFSSFQISLRQTLFTFNVNTTCEEIFDSTFSIEQSEKYQSLAERPLVPEAARSAAVSGCNCVSSFHLNFVAARILEFGVPEGFRAHSLADQPRSTDVVMCARSIPLALHDIGNKD